jgi:transaldolase
MFADDFLEMERQAHELASWGNNVYVKIPVTNTAGQFTGELIHRLSAAGVKLNVTALMTQDQVQRVCDRLSVETNSVLSVLAGHIANTGRDPIPVMRQALEVLTNHPKAQLAWDGSDVLTNIFQADSVGCHIITATGDLLSKLPLIGKDLGAYSLETATMFQRDAVGAGYSIDIPDSASVSAATLREPAKMRKVLVTGGAGYVGCVLVPKLLDTSCSVVVYDLMLFGTDGLPNHPNLETIEGDLRDVEALTAALDGVDIVIHLACISNDPSFELDPSLSKTINFDCFEPLVLACKSAGVKRFIFASTSSVYGVSDAPEVTEEHPLVPLTDYNKYKGLCEPVLLKHQSPEFTTVVIRPATVCGYSPRMRFDLSVNILTNHAVNRRKITVFGGSQKRPNIHIEDITDLYVQLLDTPEEMIAGEIFNAGYQNYTISEIAEMVRSVVEEEIPKEEPISIETTESNDIRSYHVSSKKIATKLGFEPKRSIEDAVRDVCNAIQSGKLPNSMDDDQYINVRTVQNIGLK